MNDYQKSQRKTVEDFHQYIEPVLRKKFRMYGEFFLVEGDNHPLAKYLDLYSGIDIWYINKDESWCRGIASRIQRPTGNIFRSFTIRKRTKGQKTEYQKRLDAIKNCYIYPYWTLQAYIVGDKLKIMGIAKTKDIINFIKDNKDVKTEENPDDGNSFYIVWWDDMLEKGYKVAIYDPTRHT
jgi:hypothetical protein